MNSICIIADKIHHPFYEVLGIEAGRLLFADLAEANESIGACGVNVIILDSGCTPQVGLSLLKRIKQCCLSVPVIFLTDISSEEVVINAFKAGAREYFKKPVNPAELTAAILNLDSLKSATSDARVPHTPQCTGADCCSSGYLNSNLPDKILNAVNFLNENMTDKIYLENVADKAGMSKFHFCRVFKYYIGLTPMQFLAVIRIEMAKGLMRKAGASISSVIYKVGYNDISEFNRQFKKMTGQTPSSFKESQKKQAS